MKRLTWILIAVGLLAFGSAALAVGRYWKGGTGGNEEDWDTGANWSGSAVPGAGDKAIFINDSAGYACYGNNGPLCDLIYMETGYTRSVELVNAAAFDSMDIRGGTFNDGGVGCAVAGGIYISSAALLSTGTWTVTADGATVVNTSGDPFAELVISDAAATSISVTAAGVVVCKKLTCGQNDSLAIAADQQLVIWPAATGYIVLTAGAGIAGPGEIQVQQVNLLGSNYTPVVGAFTTTAAFVFVGDAVGDAVSDTLTLGGAWTCDSLHFVSGCVIQGNNAVTCRGMIVETAVDFNPSAISAWTLTGGVLNTGVDTSESFVLVINADSTVEVSDGGGFSCRSLSVSAGDTLILTASGYLVAGDNNFIACGAGSALKGTGGSGMLCYIPQSLSQGAISMDAATVSCYFTTGADVLTLTGDITGGTFTTGCSGAGCDDNPDSTCTVDISAITVNGVSFDLSAGGSGRVTLLTGTQTINLTGALYLGTNAVRGNLTFAGCSLAVAGNVGRTLDSSSVTGSGIFVLNGAAAQSFRTALSATYPRLVSANTHASGVTFANALTCSTFTVTSATTASKFAGGSTHTFLVSFVAEGTLGVTSIRNDTLYAAVLDVPVGSRIRGCTVRDIVSTTPICAWGSVPLGGNRNCRFVGE